MSRSASKRPLDQYLELKRQADRIEFLKTMHSTQKYLPLSAVEDLFCLDLSAQEQMALIKVTNANSKLELEHFFTSVIATSQQDVAVTALLEWAARTDQLLWFRLVQTIQLPHLPQRLRYSILGVVNNTGGSTLLKAIANGPSIDEFSSAFQGLILQKAVSWNFSHESFDKVAMAAIASLDTTDQAGLKAFPSALTYLARFSPSTLAKLYAKADLSETWRPILNSLMQQGKAGIDKNLEKILKKPAGSATRSEIEEHWPNITVRHKLSREHITAALEAFVRDKTGSGKTLESHMFSGIDGSVLCQAICAMSDDIGFATASSSLEDLIPSPIPSEIVTNAVDRLQKTANPQVLLTTINRKIRVELSIKAHGAKENETIAKIKADENQTLKRALQDKYSPQAALDFKAYPEVHKDIPDWAESSLENKTRKDFFSLAYRNAKGNAKQETSYWAQLTQVWQKPDLDGLAKLTTLARQAPSLWQLCFLHCIGRFRGENQAALKLLDFIRTDEELELRAVINALSGIGTPRANQELISTITRPNVNIGLQLEICHLLKGKDLAPIQGEIRSAISDLKPQPGGSENDREVFEALEALLLPEPEAKTLTTSGSEGIQAIDMKEFSSENLDQSLSAKIPHYTDTSSEVRRALRTAEFFYKQITGSDSHNVIDLSPLIDMQYKALELTFREMFEEPCRQLINTGALQRKLDVLGYARPIEQQMNQFENYISSINIVNTIPFFSKFKLRKMLRAICQFRPGKRFTLDGLKAFGLFFLCFGRHECRYGLANLFPLAFNQDSELAEFCKKLHVFQDFRNRAAHEGFQPEARNDIEEIWRLTAEIVALAFKVKTSLAGKSFGRDQESVQGFKAAKPVEVVHKKVS